MWSIKNFNAPTSFTLNLSMFCIFFITIRSIKYFKIKVKPCCQTRTHKYFCLVMPTSNIDQSEFYGYMRRQIRHVNVTSRLLVQNQDCVDVSMSFHMCWSKQIHSPTICNIPVKLWLFGWEYDRVVSPGISSKQTRLSYFPINGSGNLHPSPTVHNIL